MNNNKSNFLDKNTIIAIVVSMVFFVMWSTYIKKNYPDADKPPVTEQVKENAEAHAKDQPAQPLEAAPATSPAETTTEVANQKEEFLSYSSAQLSFEVTSLGMGLRKIDVRAYKQRDEKPIIFGDVNSFYPFATYLNGNDKPIFFKIESTGANSFKGVALADGMTIEKTLTIDPARYQVTTEVKVTGAPAGFKGLATYLSDTLFEQPTSIGIFGGTQDHQKLYYRHEGSNEHNTITKNDGAQLAEKNIEIAALGSHYFTMALANRSDLMPRLEANIPANAATASLRLIHEPVNPSAEFKVAFDGFAGPKQLKLLEDIHPNMGDVIHYGVFAWLAKPMLKLMKLLFGIFNNWGWAIVVLTLIVRVIVMPFNIYSFRSMKAMQKIQPEMQRLREKYKSDPQTMNREVMDLMKRSGANPIGGCLPMLLQLPVFIALYSVLSESIELYRAPFTLWIHDLSIKDPYYVLPVLMGITMYIQQKITPSPNMDPAQQKVLQFMPIIFTLFMVSLPSGLTLYIFISTLFGITQQYIFMREKNPDAKISQVQA